MMPNAETVTVEMGSFENLAKAPVGSLLSEIDTGADNNYLLHKKFKYHPKGTVPVSREGEKEEMSTSSEPSSQQQPPFQAADSDKDARGSASSSVGDVGTTTGNAPPFSQTGNLPPKDKPAYLIRWNRFEDQVCNAFAELFCSDQFVDVTLACDGELLKCHKIVLAMSSPFFRRIFQETPCKHPVVIIKGMAPKTLKSILQYLYLGEVVLQKNEINHFMDAADYLSICGVLANLYSCDISTTTVDENGREREDSEAECSDIKYPEETGRSAENEESDGGGDEEKKSQQCGQEDKEGSVRVTQSPVIKYHGVKSRWHRRYSNTSYHGTPTTSSPVNVEHKRSASAGEIDTMPTVARDPPTEIGRPKIIQPLVEAPSDVEMGSGEDGEREDERVRQISPTEGEQSPESTTRKIIQRAYPKDYSSCEDSTETHAGEWRSSHPQVHSSYHQSTASSSHHHSSRPMRSLPYPIGTKDFSHPLQVSVEHTHPQGTFSTGAASTGALDHSRVRSHSGFTLYTPPQSSRTMYRAESDSEFPATSSPMSLMGSQGKDERPSRYRQYSGSADTSPTAYHHRHLHSHSHGHVEYAPHRPHHSLLSTHSWQFQDAHRPRPSHHEESARDRDRDTMEARYHRSESLDRGLSGSRGDMYHTTHLRMSNLGSKPHSYSSAADLSVPVSQQFALGFIPQLRSPSSTSVTASATVTRPKTKAIRSSQVPQSSRYTAAEVDQMVDAVANIPGNIVPCTLCQKYVKRERLRAHIHECHLLTGEKIICPHCGIALKSKGSFRVHIWRHKRGALPTRSTMTEYGRDPSGPPSPNVGPASH